jgi:hypothetical protein
LVTHYLQEGWCYLQQVFSVLIGKHRSTGRNYDSNGMSASAHQVLLLICFMASALQRLLSFNYMGLSGCWLANTGRLYFSIL